MSADTSCRSEEHTSELQSHHDLVCRLLLEKKKDRQAAEPATHAVRVTELRAGRATGGDKATDRLPFRARRFFFNDTATTDIYTLSLHDALPISKKIAATASRAKNMKRFLLRWRRWRSVSPGRRSSCAMAPIIRRRSGPESADRGPDRAAAPRTAGQDRAARSRTCAAPRDRPSRRLRCATRPGHGR